MDWYYVENGGQRGPVDELVFRELQAQGVVTPETLVWKVGMTEWLPLSRTLAPDIAVTPATAAEHGMAACAECGILFPQGDMIQFRGTYICATCKPVFFQRLKEGAKLPGQMNYAGFWIRYGAHMIDWLILAVVGSTFGALLGGFSQAFGSDEALMAALVLSTGLNLIVWLAYRTFFVGRFGATLGKMALGLKVVRADGEKLTYGRALGRAGSQMVSRLILYIGYVMAGFDDEKRALHDRMCDTRVVRTRTQQ